MPRTPPRIHFRTRHYKTPRAICRPASLFMELTDEASQVTCEACLRFMRIREHECPWCGAPKHGPHDDQCESRFKEMTQ